MFYEIRFEKEFWNKRVEETTILVDIQSIAAITSPWKDASGEWIFSIIWKYRPDYKTFCYRKEEDCKNEYTALKKMLMTYIGMKTRQEKKEDE